MRRALLAVALLLLTATGCRADVLVRVDVEEDGSGFVAVAVGLDQEAAGRVPDLAEQLRVDDLVRTGWDVTGPAPEDDGRTWVRATKPFSTPDEAAAVLAEVTGADGPVRGFAVARRRSLAFSDPALAERLDGLPLGQEVADVLGDTPPGEALVVTLAVGLPGEVAADGADDVALGVALWEVALGEGPVEVAAGTTDLRTATVVWLAVAGLAALALVLVLLVRGVRLRRR